MVRLLTCLCSPISHTSHICPKSTMEFAHQLILYSFRMCSLKFSTPLPILTRMEANLSSQTEMKQAMGSTVSIFHNLGRNVGVNLWIGDFINGKLWKQFGLGLTYKGKFSNSALQVGTSRRLLRPIMTVCSVIQAGKLYLMTRNIMRLTTSPESLKNVLHSLPPATPTSLHCARDKPNLLLRAGPWRYLEAPWLHYAHQFRSHCSPCW